MSLAPAATAARPAGPEGLADVAESARTRATSGEFPVIYLLLLFVALVGSTVYSLRVQGIFACPASGYQPDRYVAYCQATSFGDYDYGAFWFDLEPVAGKAAAEAQVLFLGNSRAQFALSTDATADWFTTLGVSHYLLGFSYNGNYLFEEPLLHKLHPLDLFFENSETPPAREVLRDHTAAESYGQKRTWQQVHRRFCAEFPFFCGHEAAVYRSRATGDWEMVGGSFTKHSVSYDESVDSALVKRYTTAGREFLAGLPVGPGCVLLTYVPTEGSAIGSAKAVARGLGFTLVAPQLEGLTMFDDSHLDRLSAERWSSAFFAAAGPQIQRCVGAR
jgi:hypothetical protein